MSAVRRVKSALTLAREGAVATFERVLGQLCVVRRCVRIQLAQFGLRLNMCVVHIRLTLCHTQAQFVDQRTRSVCFLLRFCNVAEQCCWLFLIAFMSILWVRSGQIDCVHVRQRDAEHLRTPLSHVADMRSTRCRLKVKGIVPLRATHGPMAWTWSLRHVVEHCVLEMLHKSTLPRGTVLDGEQHDV